MAPNVAEAERICGRRNPRHIASSTLTYSTSLQAEYAMLRSPITHHHTPIFLPLPIIVVVKKIPPISTHGTINEVLRWGLGFSSIQPQPQHHGERN